VPKILAHSQDKQEAFVKYNNARIGKLPSTIIETRWGSAIKSMLYHHKYLADEVEALKQPIFTEGRSKVMLTRALKQAQNPKLVEELFEVNQRYSAWPYRIAGMESNHLLMSDQFRAIDRFADNVIRFKDTPKGKQVFDKFKEVFDKNKSYHKLRHMVNNGDPKFKVYKYALGEGVIAVSEHFPL